MHLMIFSPGKVSYGVPQDETDDNEIYNIMYAAATVEQGNGGKTRQRKECKEDIEYGYKSQERRRRNDISGSI